MAGFHRVRRRGKIGEKNGEVIGMDEVTGEMIKGGGDMVVDWSYDRGEWLGFGRGGNS